MTNGIYLRKMCAPLLSAGQGKEFVTSLIKGSVPGSKKLEFPYELPPLEIEFTPEAKNTLFVAMGILGGGFALNGMLNYLSKK